MHLVLHFHTASRDSAHVTHAQNLHSCMCHTSLQWLAEFFLFAPQSLACPPLCIFPSSPHPDLHPTLRGTLVYSQAWGAFPCTANISWAAVWWPPREPALTHTVWFSDVCFLLGDRADSAIFSHKNQHSQDKNKTKPIPNRIAASIPCAKLNQGWWGL